MDTSESFKVKRNLTALVEFSRVVNASLDLNFILNNILFTCMGKFLATRGLVALKTNGGFQLKSSKGISEETQKKFPKIFLNGDILEDKSLQSYLNETKLQAIEKINSYEECLGFICLGEKLNQSPYSEDDREFLRTILNISATAIQNSKVLDELTRVNRQLDSRIQRLSSLFELSKEFGLVNESTKVARLLVYSVIGQFLVYKFAVITFEEGELKVLESKISNIDLEKILKEYDLKNLTATLFKEEIQKNYPELDKLKIELVIPMQIQGKTKGLILLGKRINNQHYTKDDVEFISSVASLAIISLENQRLFLEALEKQKIEEELEIARDIQKNLLPQTSPSFTHFEVAAENLSSRQVGGDYFDMITLDDKSFCVAIGDVVGKGVPAALLMANLQAFLKVICKQGMKLNEATGLINDLVSENITDGKFITFCWAVLNNEDISIEYVNAGHNPPLLIRDKKIIKLDKGGIILGVMKTLVPYESESIKLKKDDVVVFFTDGISEAKNTKDEEFSDERLEKLVLELTALDEGSTKKSASEILTSVKKEVQNFAYGAVQSDDITLMVIKVK
ncbi:MAG TPA: GAF domain-containing SpoIIE family protein phosphatase [Ignavibacteriaceae bacterium]|nr:GAF domain-containing SpoIIE family protein phosphatase [Ignavibacteriaceae bacterium]